MCDKKPEYRVTLEVDIQADSAEQAAKLIHALILDPASESHIYSVRERKYYANSTDVFYGQPVNVDLSNEPTSRQLTAAEQLLISEVRKDNTSGRLYAVDSDSLQYKMCEALCADGFLVFLPYTSGWRHSGFMIKGHENAKQWLTSARKYQETIAANLVALQREADTLAAAIAMLETE